VDRAPAIQPTAFGLAEIDRLYGDLKRLERSFA
jgi:hypothetical protein